jgi:dTDP-4-amino-4,6-dideoxygalactose transaminase
MSALGSERKLTQCVGREYGMALGNATTGLYSAMLAAGLRGADVAVPYNVCPNVVLAVLFSGNTPVFVDIEGESNGMDPFQLRKLAKKVKGVIAVHSYGAICKIKEIQEVCSEHSLFLIEDCAQSLGAESTGSPVGRYGAVSVFSFGRGKIIDVGHGGIAVTDDAHLFKEMQLVLDRLDQASDKKRERIAEFNDLHTMFYNRFWDSDVSRFAFIFRNLARELQGAFLQKFDEQCDDAVVKALTRLSQNIDERHQKAKIFRSFCKSKDIPFFDPPAGSVYWRFNVYIKKGRDRLLQTLLSENFKVSSWYPAVDPFFYETGDVRKRGLCADRIGEEILNLWVNDEVAEAYCHEVMERIGYFVEQFRSEALAGRGEAVGH